MRAYSPLHWDIGTDKVHRLTGTCSLCGQEYRNNNLFASSYCDECGKKVKREKTAERVRRHREKKRLEQEQAQAEQAGI